MNFIRNRTTVKVLLCVCLVLGSAATVMAVKPILFGLTVLPKKIMVGDSWDRQDTYSNNSRSIATLNGNVYATWSKADEKLYVSVNRNDTGYFESANVVMEGPDAGYGADMVATSNSGLPELHLAWYANQGKIYYARTRIGGSNDSVPYGWTKSLIYQGEPLVNWSNSIAADDAGNVHIAFPARDSATLTTSLYILNSDDRGVTFGPPVTIASSLATSGYPGVSIAKDGNGNLHVVWGDLGTLYYANSSDGINWSDKAAISDTFSSSYVSLATTQDGKIYAVWGNSVSGLVCTYNNDGNWFESVVDSEGSGDASVAISPTGDVNVAYKAGDRNIYLARSLSQGADWEPRALVQAWDDTGGGYYPSVAVGTDNKAHIVWTDDFFIAYTREQ